MHGQQQCHQQIAADVKTPHTHGLANQRLQGCGDQQQAGEQQTHPEMGLPEQVAPGHIAEPFHGGLQAQEKQAARTGQSPQQPLPHHAALEQTPKAEQHGTGGQQQTNGMGGPKAVAEADQHRHQHTAGDPGTVLGVLHRHGVGDWVDLEPLFPRQDPQPDRGTHHRVDKQNHQHGVDQSEPVVAAERLQCLGISQKKNATLTPGLRTVGL